VLVGGPGRAKLRRLAQSAAAADLANRLAGTAAQVAAHEIKAQYAAG
jgi:hypothetical protein